MHKRVLAIGLATMLSAGLVGYSAAASSAAATTDLSAVTKKTTTTHKTTTVKRSGGTAVKRTTTVNKKVNVNRNVKVNRTVNVNRHVTYSRGYRAWVARPYYGTAFIGAVALGTVIAVSAAHAIPVAPGPNACWYWSDPLETSGYWDYCVPPP